MDRTQITCAVINNLSNLITLHIGTIKDLSEKLGFDRNAVDSKDQVVEVIAAINAYAINSIVDAIIAGAKEST